MVNVALDAEGLAANHTVFAEGWLYNGNQTYWGAFSILFIGLSHLHPDKASSTLAMPADQGFELQIKKH